jgi:hypothetical protein
LMAALFHQSGAIVINNTENCRFLDLT